MNEGFLTAETDPVALSEGYLTAEELDLCPVGYAHDDTETQFTLCYDPDSALGADEMVRVGDFWIDRYEASVWEFEDCTGTFYGATSGYPAEFPDTGNWSAPVYACSLPDEWPSAEITWFQAQQACAASGKVLCTNEQWQAATAGVVDPGSFDATGGGPCNTAGAAVRLTGNAGATAADASSCISQWGAEDLIGNVWEWTSTWQNAGVSWQTADVDPEHPWPASYPPDVVAGLSGTAKADDGTFTEGLPAAAIRGGWAGDGEDAGAFSLLLYESPAQDLGYVGFRCCRSR